MRNEITKENIRIVCKTIIEDSITHEIDFFDDVWGAFWRSVGCDALEDLNSIGIGPIRDMPVFNLGAIGQQEGQVLDTLYAIGTCCFAAASLVDSQEEAQLKTADIREALKIQGKKMKAPQHVRTIVEKYAVGLLANLHGASDWKDDARPEEVVDEGYVWVEWCDETIDESQPANLLESLHHNYIPIEQAKEDFAPQKQFRLIVDETTPLLSIWCYSFNKRLRQPIPIDCSELEPRHKKLLGLILCTFKRSSDRLLPYKTICELVLDEGYYPEKDRAISRAKSDLDSILRHVLKKVVVAGGMKNYKISRQISYCWIRKVEARSVLFPYEDIRFERRLKQS